MQLTPEQSRFASIPRGTQDKSKVEVAPYPVKIFCCSVSKRKGERDHHGLSPPIPATVTSPSQINVLECFRHVVLVVRQCPPIVHMPLIAGDVTVDIPLRACSKSCLTRCNSCKHCRGSTYVTAGYRPCSTTGKCSGRTRARAADSCVN